jgi:predicted SprT family Zn-dependent metalloprotease
VLELKRAIYWGWNSTLKTTFGKAYLREGRVVLASKLWKRATPKERCEVVAHEICHIAAFDRFKSHGHEHGWRMMMKKCGYSNAARCHRISVKGLVTRHPVFCDCKVHMVTPQMFKSIRGKKKSYTCRLCSSKLREES